MLWQSQKMPCSTWSPVAWPSTRGILHGTSTLWRYQLTPWQRRKKKSPFPQHGAGPHQLVWGSCGAVGWLLPFPATAGGTVDSPWLGGTPVHPQVLPWKAKSRQQQAGAGLAGVPVHRQ